MLLCLAPMLTFIQTTSRACLAQWNRCCAVTTRRNSPIRPRGDGRGERNADARDSIVQTFEHDNGEETKCAKAQGATEAQHCQGPARIMSSACGSTKTFCASIRIGRRKRLFTIHWRARTTAIWRWRILFWETIGLRRNRRGREPARRNADQNPTRRIEMVAEPRQPRSSSEIALILSCASVLQSPLSPPESYCHW